MSTQSIDAWLDPSTGTFARTIQAGGTVQVLRDGEEVARYDTHPNERVTFRSDGRCQLSGQRAVDLRAPFPQEPRPYRAPHPAHPRGTDVGRALCWMPPPFPLVHRGRRFPGLLSLRLDPETGAVEEVEVWWDGAPREVPRIAPFGPAPSAATASVSELEIPDLLVAADGETWGLVNSHHAVIGHATRVAQLGGWPRWWQSAVSPRCDGCRRSMFFVGQAAASALLRDAPDAMLYGFVCAQCGRAAQLVQLT